MTAPGPPCLVDGRRFWSGFLAQNKFAVSNILLMAERAFGPRNYPKKRFFNRYSTLNAVLDSREYANLVSRPPWTAGTTFLVAEPLRAPGVCRRRQHVSQENLR